MSATGFWQFGIERTLGRATVKPGFARWLLSTACRLHLRSVRDPELRRRLTPDYEPLCKRLVMATNVYSQFKRPTVELVDVGIDHIEPRGIVTRDGRLHELDVIVLATGFDAHAYLKPLELVGLDGVRLSELWDGEPYGYRSVALPGFPNVFTLLGPHSPIGNQSICTVSETQIDFALALIDVWREGEVDAMWPSSRGDGTVQRRAARRDSEHDLGLGLQELVHRQGRYAAPVAMDARAPPRDARQAAARGVGVLTWPSAGRERRACRQTGAQDTDHPVNSVRRGAPYRSASMSAAARSNHGSCCSLTRPAACSMSTRMTNSRALASVESPATGLSFAQLAISAASFSNVTRRSTAA